MNKEDFGKWIKDLRVECDYTQDKLAKLLGFNNSQSIANIESGRALLPKRAYKKFVEVFRLDADKFIELILSAKKAELTKIIKGKSK